MSDPIAFDGGLTLAIPVSNLDNAIAWYSEVLGCELLYRVDDISWCEMTSPIARVSIGLSAVETPNPGGPTPTIGVEDIEAARKSLQAQDIKLDGDIMTIDGLVRLQTFYDPDGNALMLYQELKSDA